MLFRVLLIVAFVAASGCSRTELVYRNADWLAYRWVDRLLDADRAQSERWSRLFDQLLQEHRRGLLPQVVALLQDASLHSERGFTTDRLACLWQGGRRLIEAHARLAIPTAVEVLDGISDAQIEHLRGELDERNAAYREDYLQQDPDEREAARIDRFTQRIERWTGPLSTEQLRLVEASVRGMPDIADDWLGYREDRQARLLALLRQGGNRQQIENFLVDWWVDQADRRPGLVDAYLRLRVDWIEMLAALDRTLDDAQRARLRDRITGLHDDLAGEMDSGIDVSSLARIYPACSAGVET